jgi:hypothetical protein
MSTTEVVDAVLRLLKALISWPLVLLVVVIIVRHQLPTLITDLTRRLRKAPGGFEFNELKEQVATVAQRVKNIEEAVVFRPSAALTPALEQQLQTALSHFYECLKTLGFKPDKGRPEVAIQAIQRNNLPAYYDGRQNLIVIGEPLAADTDVALHEYTHHMLSSVAPQPHPGSAYYVIEAGLADYFPCSFTGNALLGEQSGWLYGRPYIWNLDNERRFTEGTPDTLVGPHQDEEEVWAGAFWEMRKLLQQKVVDRLLFSTWADQSPADISSGDRQLFVRGLMNEARRSADSEAAATIQSIFQRRGLEV